MIRKNTGELTPKEERELLQEFECVDRYCDAVIPPAPKGEFEKIIAEMKKRNIVPQVREELRKKLGRW